MYIYASVCQEEETKQEHKLWEIFVMKEMFKEETDISGKLFKYNIQYTLSFSLSI